MEATNKTLKVVIVDAPLESMRVQKAAKTKLELETNQRSRNQYAIQEQRNTIAILRSKWSKLENAIIKFKSKKNELASEILNYERQLANLDISGNLRLTAGASYETLDVERIKKMEPSAVTSWQALEEYILMLMEDAELYFHKKVPYSIISHILVMARKLGKPASDIDWEDLEAMLEEVFKDKDEDLWFDLQEAIFTAFDSETQSTDIGYNESLPTEQ